MSTILIFFCFGSPSSVAWFMRSFIVEQVCDLSTNRPNRPLIGFTSARVYICRVISHWKFYSFIFVINAFNASGIQLFSKTNVRNRFGIGNCYSTIAYPVEYLNSIEYVSNWTDHPAIWIAFTFIIDNFKLNSYMSTKVVSNHFCASYKRYATHHSFLHSPRSEPTPSTSFADESMK